MRLHHLRPALLLITLALLGCPEPVSTHRPPPILQPQPAKAKAKAQLAPPTTDDTQVFLRALQNKRSGVWMTVQGRVTRTLKDDLKGDRHQRFLIDIEGHSVLVAHNIDLADRASLRRGDTVQIRGRYEYNEKGGVLHWTHHDPRGKKTGGFIQVGEEIVR